MKIFGILYGLLFVLFSNSPEFTYLETLIGLIFGLMILLKTKSWPINSVTYLTSPLLFAVVLFIQSFEFNDTFTGVIELPKSWLSIQLLFCFMAFSYRRQEIFYYVGFGLFIGLAINTLEYFNILNFLNIVKDRSRFGGSLVNPNSYAFMAITGLFWILIYRYKIRYWFVFLILCIHIIWFQALSRTYMVTSLFILLTLFNQVSFKNLFFLAVGFFIIINFVKIDFSNTTNRFLTIGQNKADLSTIHRVNYFQRAIEYWLEKPIFGWGTDAFRNINNSSYSHNNFSEILCNHGIIGFLIFYSLHLIMIINSFITKNYIVIVIVISMLISDLGIVSIIEKSSWFVLYLGISKLVDNEKNDSNY